MQMYKIAVDIGGTFTDVAISSDTGTIIAKSPTTPASLANGIVEAITLACEEIGISIQELFRDASHFVHGTTVGTNAIIERSGARVGLITTKGHEDTLSIGRVFSKRAGLTERQIIHLVQLDKPQPLLPRRRIRGVSERIDSGGDIVVGLNEAEVGAAARHFRNEDVEAVAISYLWSFVNPAHEVRTREILASEMPDTFVTISSDIAPVLGEYERTVTTVLNCYLGPLVKEYLTELQRRVDSLGYSRPVLIMQSGGGVVSAPNVQDRAVVTIDSGPVGGALGARYYGAALGENSLICTDVGGTSFDVGLIRDGNLQLETKPVVSQYVYVAPKILIKSIGAGGGSIAWRDELGYLHVGPHSAGSFPGPACYGRGGEQPTLTDADLVLGYINPEYFLGGRQELDRSQAERTLKGLAEAMDMDLTEVAAGIVDIANAQMADLLRQATIEQGYDPSEFVVVSFGGAGPVHAAFYASEAAAKYVLVPPEGSVFSALGMLSADVFHVLDVSRPMRTPLTQGDFEEVNGLFADITQQMLDTFSEEGYAAKDVELQREAFLRYPTQVHELAISVPMRPLGLQDEALLAERLNDNYALVYGKEAAFEAGFELLTLRLTGRADPGKPSLVRTPPQPASSNVSGPMSERKVFFNGAFVATDVYRGEFLTPGQTLVGPAVVERMGDTVVIPPDSRATVDELMCIRIERRT
jgi:N-methylhydantoinase A